MFFVERVENDDVVNAIEKFGIEGLFQGVVDFALHQRVHRVGIGLLEAQYTARAHIPTARVRGHNQHGVAKIYFAARAVGEPSLVENLQQDIENIGMGFLDLV